MSVQNLKRRHFLSYISVACATLLLPSSAHAADSTYEGPLWIFVHASGGWDPTSLCDPKGWTVDPVATPATAREQMNQAYAKADIKTASGSSIKYAPISPANSSSTYDFSTFFEKYGKDLLVINGIDMQTNGHSSGTRYTFSGKLGEGHPSLAAIIAAVHTPSSPLGYITYGGYDFTDGIVAASRIGSAEIVEKLAFPNKWYSTKSFHNPNVYQKVRMAKEAHDKKLLGSQTLANKRESIEQYYNANIASTELKKLMQFLPTNQTGDSTMLKQVRFAMATYKAGLTSSVSLRSGGFDTHGDHDNRHLRNLGTLVSGLDDILQEAQAQGLSRDIVLVVGSDFGRTPKYNNSNGKDHWPVGSMMFLGQGIRGGRVIGKTDDKHTIVPQDGLTLTNAHIHQALRKLANVDKHPLTTQKYPINEKTLDLFS